MNSVVIHPNTGENVGLGHLVRCITLTKELRSHGVETDLLIKDDERGRKFAVEEGVGPLISSPETLFEVLSQSSSDCIVIDSYEFTTDDFETLANSKILAVIDELGDRRIPADLVINNNIYADEIDYPDANAILRGPEYCMLREAFRDLEEPEHHDPPESLLVTVGGADLAGEFDEILYTSASVVEETTINAVVGPYFDPPDDAPEQVRFHKEPSNIEELMWKADLAVSGGGQTLYELAACGTPAVSLILGSDQRLNVTRFKQEGFCVNGGRPEGPEFEKRLREGLQELLDPIRRQKAASTGQNIVDGGGVVRVANQLLSTL